jgi:putative transposase
MKGRPALSPCLKAGACAPGKKVKGRKRRLLVDTEGFELRVVIRPANNMDRDGVKLVLHESTRIDFLRLRHIWLDSAYDGQGKDCID